MDTTSLRQGYAEPAAEAQRDAFGEPCGPILRVLLV